MVIPGGHEQHPSQDERQVTFRCIQSFCAAWPAPMAGAIHHGERVAIRHESSYRGAPSACGSSGNRRALALYLEMA